MTLSLARFAGLAAATVAVVCGAGVWPTISAAGAGALLAVGAAAALALVGAVAGFLPFALAHSSASLETRAQAWMIGLGVRLFLTMAALAAVWFAEMPHRAVFLVWTGILYVALLVLEVVVAVRSLHGGDAAAQPRASA